MSTVTLRMPRLGETMERGTVASWLVEEGESFARGAPLVEFETDKTAVEYPALGSGRLARRLVGAGDVVELGAPIAEIDLEGAADWVSGEGGASSDRATEAPDGAAVIEDLLMPRLGETMEEGTITAWLVAEGARYERGAPILEVETDKTVAEVPALRAARLVEILARPGDVVAVDRPIARIELAAGDARPAPPAEPGPESPGEAPAVAAPVGSGPASPARRATPAARRAARQAGVAIEALRGTGRRGRIELSDVEAAGRGGALAATQYGPPGPARVVLIHGFAGDRLTFDRLGKALGRGGLPVRAVDLPGHGETRDEARSIDDLVSALAAELASRPPAHLVAHSLGAAVAVRAVADGAPARSLTLIAPAGIGPAIDGAFVAGMAEPASAGAVGHLLRRVSVRAAGFSEEMVTRVHGALAGGRLAALAAEVAAGDRQRIDVVPALARLAERLPVRILTGHRDAILDWRDALAVSPRIAVHHFPEAGHMPHWDAPDTVRDLLIEEFSDE